MVGQVVVDVGEQVANVLGDDVAAGVCVGEREAGNDVRAVETVVDERTVDGLAEREGNGVEGPVVGVCRTAVRVYVPTLLE